MLQPIDEAKIDDISTRHVNLNKKFLSEFFDTNYTSRTFPLMASGAKYNKFCEAVERLKYEFEKSLYLRKIKVSYPVQKRRTIINPSPSPSGVGSSQLHPTTQPSTSSNQRTIHPTSPKTPENMDQNEFEAPMAPRKPQQAQAIGRDNLTAAALSLHSAQPETPKPRLLVVSTPHPRLVVRPPTTLTADEIRSKREAGAGRFDFNESPHRRAGPSNFLQTPKSIAGSRTQRHRTTQRNLEPSFQVKFASPNQSGITKITCDKNISNEEIEKVNEIIGNISVLTGAEIQGNAIALSTRNTTVTRGKYKLYKILRTE